MWFKQLQLFKLAGSLDYSIGNLTKCLEQFLFEPGLPSMPLAMGWVSLLDEEGAPLVRSINNCVMVCLQIEEKLLPATVIRQALTEKIKQIETAENRKVRQKEKYTLKDEIIFSLLPRAFSKLTRIYAYIDVQQSWLVLGTADATKTEQFLSAFKKSISQDIHLFNSKKLSPILTHWLKERSYPSTFSIEKACVLQDPNQKSRVIRCQHQDLFANGIQALIKDGCEVRQLALSWQDQINFVLMDDFSLRSIQFQDEVRVQAKEMEPETALQRFDADFIIMATMLSKLLKELLSVLIKPSKSVETSGANEKIAINLSRD